jgi:hypothetical protein
MSQHRSIQRSVFPLEYNKNIAQRPKTDLAFRVHHLAWMAQIEQENLNRDPFNINTLLKPLTAAALNDLKAPRHKSYIKTLIGLVGGKGVNHGV